MEKILTISIAAYNAVNDLDRCLTSMLQTEIADLLDIVVVNDGSKDHTCEVAAKYVEAYPGIVRLIDKENGGHGSTINSSIQVAAGKYYKIVDSDDWVDKDGLEQLVKTLVQADTDLILNPYYIVNAETKEKELVRPFANAQVTGIVQTLEPETVMDIPMHSITYKTEIIKKMGPVISEKCFYVDMEYVIFPLVYVRNYLCLEAPVYNYLLGTATQSMNIANVIKRRDQHLHVVKRITEFYCEKKDSMHPAVQKMILRRVQIAAMVHYKIYFSMEAKDSQQEIIAFDNWLKQAAPEVYSFSIGKFTRILEFNRCTNFRFYPITSKSLKLWNQIFKK